jgi:hypothetical protein
MFPFDEDTVEDLPSIDLLVYDVWVEIPDRPGHFGLKHEGGVQIPYVKRKAAIKISEEDGRRAIFILRYPK